MKRENLIITGKIVSFLILTLISLTALYFGYYGYRMRQENLHVSLPEGPFLTTSNFEIDEFFSDFEIEVWWIRRNQCPAVEVQVFQA